MLIVVDMIGIVCNEFVLHLETNLKGDNENDC